MHVIVLPWSTRIRGGVSVVVQQLADHWQHSGVRAQVVVDDWSVGTAAIEMEGELHFSFRVLAEPVSTAALLKALFPAPLKLWRTRQFLRARDCEGINFHYPGLNAFGIAVLKALGLFSGRLVLSFHGTDVREPVSALERWLWSFMLARCDAVTTCSLALRDRLLETLPVEAALVQVAYNGVDRSLFHPEQAQGGDERPHQIVSLGSYIPRKGHSTLLEAFSLLVAQPPHSKLRLCIAGGDGDTYQALSAQAAALGITDRVELLRDLTSHQVASLLRGACLAVQPSLAEPFGLAVIEAAACGVPVAVSAVGGHLEIVENGRTGWTFNAGDVRDCFGAMNAALSDAGEAKTRANRLAQEVAARFSWQRLASQMDTLLR